MNPVQVNLDLIISTITWVEVGCRVMCGVVGGWWGFGGVGGCIPLSGILVGWWHFGGVFEWYLNGSFNEFRWVPFGSFAGVSLVRRGSGWWGVILFVPLELHHFLVVSACGVVFHFSPMIS